MAQWKHTSLNTFSIRQLRLDKKLYLCGMTKEEEILAAAEEEFFKNGYDATSTANIAKRAGVTHAMVNYYFRTKEKLYMQILDNHVYGLLRSLKPLMVADGNVAGVAVEAAKVIFDTFYNDRHFPFLVTDIVRTHPDFLLRYKESVIAMCMDSIGMHEQRLQKCITDGVVTECTMNDIYYNVITLTTSPFMDIPMLENVAGLTPEQIDSFLETRREDMVRMLQARFLPAVH